METGDNFSLSDENGVHLSALLGQRHIKGVGCDNGLVKINFINVKIACLIMINKNVA